MTDDPAEQNPLEALAGGLGGLDLGGLLQQAQQMQDQLQATQRELADTLVEGSVAGGAVTVTVNGVGELTGVTITPAAVDGDAGPTADDLAEVGDLVVAAYRDARAKADALASEKLGPLAGGLPGFPEGPGAGSGPLGFA
ncbi:MAG TPA: YbaB/EbfC family nucleoid-associated protein [Nocardioides sp.]|nr:YbaB/EbfC family nucleoid-associated protein [Nocardioides sp.]